MTLKIAIKMLLKIPLSIEEKNSIVINILDNLTALPIRAIITASEEGILINGAPLDFESAKVMRDGATRVLTNKAFQLCADQVRFAAVQKGLATGLQPEELLFFRAALWYADELKSHLAILAQSGSTTVRE